MVRLRALSPAAWVHSGSRRTFLADGDLMGALLAPKGPRQVHSTGLQCRVAPNGATTSRGLRPATPLAEVEPSYRCGPRSTREGAGSQSVEPTGESLRGCPQRDGPLDGLSSALDAERSPPANGPDGRDTLRLESTAHAWLVRVARPECPRTIARVYLPHSRTTCAAVCRVRDAPWHWPAYGSSSSVARSGR